MYSICSMSLASLSFKSQRLTEAWAAVHLATQDLPYISHVTRFSTKIKAEKVCVLSYGLFLHYSSITVYSCRICHRHEKNWQWGTINFPLSFWTRVKDSNVIIIVYHYQRQILAAPQHQCRLCGRVRAQFSRHSSRSLRGSAVGVFTAVNSFVWVCVHVLLHNIAAQLHCICVEVSKHMQIQMHPCLLPFQFICMFLQHVCLFAPLWGYAMHIPQLQENNILGRLACMCVRVCVWFVSLPCLPQGGAVPFPIIVQILPEIMPLRI